jgi:hypothetical protein
MSHGGAISPYEKKEKGAQDIVVDPLSLMDDIKQGYATLHSTFTVRQRQIVDQTQLAEKIDRLGAELKKMQGELKEQDMKNREYFIIGTIIGVAGIVIGIVVAIFL